MLHINRKKLALSLAFVLIAIVLFLVFRLYYSREKERGFMVPTPLNLHIFIHGSVCVPLNFINPMHCLYDSADEQTRSVKLLRRFRQHELLEEDQAFLKEGLTILDHGKISQWYRNLLKGPEARLGAYHIAALYDTVLQFSNLATPQRRYGVFGWSGLLSNKGRRAAAQELYSALTDYRDAVMNAQGISPRFSLVGHSHGGNVILHLAEFEEEYKRGLQIDTVLLYGTPMIPETKDHLTSTMFNTIISCYSYGDDVQNNDRFSTRARKSMRRMAELADIATFVSNNPGKVRVDVRLEVDHDDKRVDHINMWFLNRSKEVCGILGPLPIFVLSPLWIKQLIKSAWCTDCVVSLLTSPGFCVLRIHARDEQGNLLPLNPIINIFDLCQTMVKKVESMWTPQDTSRNLVWSTKVFSALKYAFTGH